MSNVITNRPPFEEIPSAIIYDILSRLPTKTCLNCKLVCKDWYQIIISHEFANLRSLQCSYITMLFHGRFDGGRFNFLLLDLDKSIQVDKVGHGLIFPVDAMIKFKPEFTILHPDLFVINECNGLICLKTGEQFDPYIICNLLTGEQVIVKQFHKPSCSVELYGLGCCPVSHQFKVLRILTISDSYKRMLEIQTLGTNEWRMIGDAPPTGRLDKSGVFLHGSLHKLCCMDNCIWSFNFENEQFLQPLTPDELQLQRGILKDMGVIKSCLCITSSPENRYEFWVMQEYGVKDSWVKLFVIEMEHFFPPRLPLLMLDTGEILFAGSHGLSLFLGLCDTSFYVHALRA